MHMYADFFHTYVVKKVVVVGHLMGEVIRRSCRVFQQTDEVDRLLLMKGEVVQKVVVVQRDKLGDVQEVSIPSRRVVVVLVVAVVADILMGLFNSCWSEKKISVIIDGFLQMSIYIPP